MTSCVGQILSKLGVVPSTDAAPVGARYGS